MSGDINCVGPSEFDFEMTFPAVIFFTINVPIVPILECGGASELYPPPQS